MLIGDWDGALFNLDVVLFLKVESESELPKLKTGGGGILPVVLPNGLLIGGLAKFLLCLSISKYLKSKLLKAVFISLCALI